MLAVVGIVDKVLRNSVVKSVVLLSDVDNTEVVSVDKAVELSVMRENHETPQFRIYCTVLVVQNVQIVTDSKVQSDLICTL